MGIPDRSLPHLLGKVRSWIRWGVTDISDSSRKSWIPNNSCRMCSECQTRLTEFSMKYHCQSCGRVLCEKCMQSMPTSIGASDGRRSTVVDEEQIKFCKFCFRVSTGHEAGTGYNERIDPSPGQSPEKVLHCFSSEKFNNNNSKPFPSHRLARYIESQLYNSPPHAVASNSVASSTEHPSPVSFRRSSSRSDEDAEDPGKLFLSPSSEYCGDISDIDSSSISARHGFYSFKSVGSSPLDSPCRMTSTPNRVGYSVQQDQEECPISQNEACLDQETMAILRRPEMETEDLENTDYCSDDLSIFRDQCEKVQQPLDFENNGHIWFPPPPDDEEDEVESNFFEYDDDDDDVGDSSTMFSSCSINTDTFPVKDKPNEEHKEPMRSVVHGHFRALVLQLLQGEGIYAGNENGGEGWLDIVTSVAWQAANFVKPDTSRGGSMDPGDYVKVKCIVSGSPSESTLIRGVVCTKNIKHKRMTTQYRNPRLLLLGGALEYQRAPNQLASFDTLLQQEIDHLKMIVSKIEAHRPNVLLVEKSVSSYAQEYLLAKEISLVLNVKRPLLERIARCTGALIVPSIDNLSSARLGHCEIFRLERILEESAVAHLANKKLAKTLMFFEGCPRRVGCTVLLKGTCREVLKKVKHVVQYAVFAAYHLSLETSFLADEGASLPKMPSKLPVAIPEKLMNTDGAISVICNSDVSSVCLTGADRPQDLGECSLSGTPSFHMTSDVPSQNDWTRAISLELQERGSSCELPNPGCAVSSGLMDSVIGIAYSDASNVDLGSLLAPSTCTQPQYKDWRSFPMIPSQNESLKMSVQENEGRALRNHKQAADTHELPWTGRDVGIEDSSEYFSTVDNHQSILVSFSSRCVLKGTVCERSQLLRIKFYGSFDKPLGRYLRDDLFDQTFCCRTCKEPTDAHVHCYTHQQGNLTINVRRLPSLELPGERDGKIWMWHRCLKCAHIDGVPPATRRVVMSDAAWGLSFGKFLELSFSNHATANRVASCGHSLQRDCLRFYGFGSMVAFFRYSPIDILSVCLPPSMLEFNVQVPQEWVKREATELSCKMEVLYAEVSGVLHNIGQQGTSLGYKHSEASEFHNHIVDLKDILKKERSGYQDLLQSVDLEDSQPIQTEIDILEVNRLRRCLLIDSYIWDHRLYYLDALLKTMASISKVDSCMLDGDTYAKLKEWREESFFKDGKTRCASEEKNPESETVSENVRNRLPNTRNHLPVEPEEEPNPSPLDPISNELTKMDQSIITSVEHYGPEDLDFTSGFHHKHDELNDNGEVPIDNTSYERLPSPASSLSEKIDSAWTGTIQQPANAEFAPMPQSGGHEAVSVGLINQMDNPSYRRLVSPARVYSFDSALRIQERIRRGLSPASLKLSSLRSFHASGDYRTMIRDPVSNMRRTFSQNSPRGTQKSNFIFSSSPSFTSSVSRLVGEGVRLLLPQKGHNKIVIPVYDNELTSVISYALGSEEYDDWIANKLDAHGGWSVSDSNKEDDVSNLSGYHSAASTFSVWQSGFLDSDDIVSRSYGADDASSTIGSLFLDPKKSSHFRISFGDGTSSSVGKVMFSVTCYFARQFDALRKKCCPSEVDFIRSLSRCNRWNAQGGKSNVYFAKSLDERFIIKQVTKTELDSFEDFAPQYFKYLTDSVSSGSPTCLAKVLGIYQVTVKHLKGGRETKMDLMVMENLFFRRSISRVYDLKGSARSRYNPDTTGKNNVLLDMNLLETLRTNPMFLGSKAKRSLERAVWNDTSFLASVDVMDYSLLVGVDNEGKELVLGIIDYMRQYTWDKHLETWVKASGILGGPKNASPTVISPKEYKKRFRKAMSTYFLTVPRQWSS